MHQPACRPLKHGGGSRETVRNAAIGKFIGEAVHINGEAGVKPMSWTSIGRPNGSAIRFAGNFYETKGWLL